MDSTQKPQVLLLGNGLLQAYGGISWEQLLQQIANRDDLPKKKDWYGEHLDLESPMPLRAIIVTKDHVDEAMKNVENPVAVISLNFLKSPSGFTRRSVFFFVKKWDIIARKLIVDPIAVASPAPNAPMSHVNTKK